MGRRRTHVPLNVLLNNRLVGRLMKAPGGAIEFSYDADWLDWDSAIPVSLSLPLSDERYTGLPVAAVFENLLPDADAIRRRIAERVGAEGSDAYSLLAAIGHDCVGALQFLPDEALPDAGLGQAGLVRGEPVGEAGIASILANLGRAPLGLDADDAFRISIAGAQEKTALLFHDGRWHKPLGTTPTTHILKPQIGELPNGIDLTNSVENEFYCLKLLEGFGLPVTRAEIAAFAGRKVLVIERFDRAWSGDGRLLRLPQEDCCQALSVPPELKYQSHGGPGIARILGLLRGSDTPDEDRLTFFKAQILFWLIGATDGHAKNFSIFLGRGGTYRMTPLYDVLTAQPSLDARQIERKQMKLAMSVGASRHDRIDEIHPRHFLQSAEDAGLPKPLARRALDEVAARGAKALAHVETALPADFPGFIHESVATALRHRLDLLTKSTRLG
jgi:serine/threonine-protein kinase HipA